MLHTRFVEKIETHILYAVAYFFKNRAVNGIKWKSFA